MDLRSAEELVRAFGDPNDGRLDLRGYQEAFCPDGFLPYAGCLRARDPHGRPVAFRSWVDVVKFHWPVRAAIIANFIIEWIRG